VVKSHWLDQILSGAKTIEIRGCDHHYVGHAIYLLESRTGRVRGTARLGAPRGLAAAELEENRAGVDEMAYRRPRAWPLTEVETLATPWQISAKARQYCPTWVPRQRWEQFPATGAAAPPPTPGRDDVAPSLLQPRRAGRARRPRGGVETAPAGEDARGDPGVGSGPAGAAPRASGKPHRRPAAAAPATAERQDRPASTAVEAPAERHTAGKRPRSAGKEAVGGKRAQLRRSGPMASFVLRAEDEEEVELAEEVEGAVLAQLDREHRGAAAETVSAVVSTGAEDQVDVDSTGSQVSAESPLPSASRPSDRESLPEPPTKTKDLPEHEPTMELLGTLPRGAAAATKRRDGLASSAEEVPATIPYDEVLGTLPRVAAAATKRRDGLASSAEEVPATIPYDEVLGTLPRVAAAATKRRVGLASSAEEVPPTIPDVEAVGKLIIRRLASIDSMSERDPGDDGFDVWEEDTIIDVVERVFARLGLEGNPADFTFQRVVLVTEGDVTTSKLIPLEGTSNAVEAKEIVLCKKGG
jgi:hypothetical protein